MIKPAMSHTMTNYWEMTLKGQKFIVIKEGKTCEQYDTNGEDVVTDD